MGFKAEEEKGDKWVDSYIVVHLFSSSSFTTIVHAISHGSVRRRAAIQFRLANFGGCHSLQLMGSVPKRRIRFPIVTEYTRGAERCLDSNLKLARLIKVGIYVCAASISSASVVPLVCRNK